LGVRVVLGTDMMTHLGAGGWHAPDEPIFLKITTSLPQNAL